MPTVRGVELFATDEGTGTPFLWGHGFTGSVQQDTDAGLLRWARLAAGLRLVRWDARGHGRSGGTPSVEDYRWDELALDLVALADAHGIGRFVAGGVSMGAATALHAAARHPDRIVGLVLVLPPTAYDTRPAQARSYREGADLVESAGIDAYVKQVNAGPSPALLRDLDLPLSYVPSIPEDLLPAVLRGAALSDLPPAAEVQGIGAPALLMAWEGDDGHPLSTATTLAELLPNAELRVARQLRDLGSWTADIQAFVDAVDGPRGLG